MRRILSTVDHIQLEEIISRFAIFSAIFITSLIYGFPDVLAAAPDYGDNSAAHTSFGSFLSSVSTLLNLVLSPGSPSATFIDAFFYFGVIYKIVVVTAKYMLLSADINDFFEAIIVIAIVRALIDLYPSLTSLLFNWTGDFAAAIQTPIVGTGDVFFLTEYLQNILGAITYDDTSLWDGFKMALSTGVLWFLLSGLSILAFFAVAWAVWGYSLAKLIGWMFIPFLLFERTVFLFDGWLRFMIGFLLYAVVARVNLVLVLVLFASYFGLPLNSGVGPVRSFPIPNIDEVGGLLSLLVIAILSLISTGRFAAALAGGVGGYGDSVSTAARFMSRGRFGKGA